ncbi:hypothetical protein BS50DRAFT_568182 [Corynespora cassiicola Philippines]|uniref:Uncharacterized protein n=1 Tax=Corynespora cassiicola Philippines TaxID=1448308 RepID=A0A2T2PD43_CORCC|nr:hypothetical protein BS50DRAFT_568182 [Corynespora cassiicola Philippines]
MYRSLASRLFLRRANIQRTSSFHPSSLPTRLITTTAPSYFPRKDTQDKDSLNPTSTEYSKSGSDDAAAAASDAAFNPNKTSPEEERDTAERESNGNPLDVSPGNPEISKPRGEQEGGAQGSPRTSASGGGSAPKSGGNKSG